MTDASHRLLIIDDNPWIHEDIRRVLMAPAEDRRLERLERELGGGGPGSEPAPPVAQPRFEIDSALQGREGVEAARRAREEGRPYAIALVDIRMPPGWDGIETIERLWEVDPEVHAVICSAYSDFSWSAIERRLGGTDRLLVLKKPFDAIEIVQLAHALAHKWSLRRAERRRGEELEALILASTAELARAVRLVVGIAVEIDGAARDVGDSLQLLRVWFDASPPAAVAAALGAASGGLGRIASIIRAAKELGRDDTSERTAVDLNRTLLATLEVARHGCRPVADVETELGELPPVFCVGSELNLVWLSLILNAAHAVGDAGGRRGKIRVHTRIDGDEILVSIASTGASQDLRTEQALALGRSLIVKHGGSLTFVTEPGGGATFTVRIPIGGTGPPAS